MELDILGEKIWDLCLKNLLGLVAAAGGFMKYHTGCTAAEQVMEIRPSFENAFLKFSVFSYFEW